MNQQDDFRNRLIASQQFTPECREEYDRRLQEMIYRQLTLAQRIVLGVSVLVGLLAVIYVGMSFIGGSQTSPPLKVAIGLLCLVTLAITGIRAYAMVTGQVNMRFHPKVIAYIAYVGIVLFIAVALMISTQAGGADSVSVLVGGLFALILVTAKILGVQIDQTELSIREKLLEIDIKLAEVNQKLQSEKR